MRGIANSGGILLSGLQTGATQARDGVTPQPAGSHPVSSAPLSFQSEMGRISRQSGIVFAGTIFTAVFGYVFKVYLAHVLGAEALGLYALGMTIISFLGIINGLGLPDSAVRFVSLYLASGKFTALRSLLWNGSWILLGEQLGDCRSCAEGRPLDRDSLLSFTATRPLSAAVCVNYGYGRVEYVFWQSSGGL